MTTKKAMIVLMMLAMALFSFSQQGEEKKDVPRLDAKAAYQKCLECMKSGKLDDAIKFGEMAVKQDEKNSKYHFQLGLAYNYKIQHKDTQMMAKLALANNILNSWKKALELNPKNRNARQGLIQFYLNAPAMAGGSPEKAMALIKEIESINPLFAHVSYTGAYGKQQDFEKAKIHAMKAFSLHMALKDKSKSPFHSMFLNSLGYQLLKAGKTAEAIEVFKKNIDAFPNFFNPYDSLAETYMKSGKKKLAIKFYKKALSLNPNSTVFEKQAYKNQKKYLEALQKGK